MAGLCHDGSWAVPDHPNVTCPVWVFLEGAPPPSTFIYVQWLLESAVV